MLPRERPDPIHVAFDDDRLVANAGLIRRLTLPHHLGLGQLVVHHIRPGRCTRSGECGAQVADPSEEAHGVSSSNSRLAQDLGEKTVAGTSRSRQFTSGECSCLRGNSDGKTVLP